MPAPVPVVVDAVRTPLGARHGRLSGWHPVDLAAEVLRALVERTGIDPAAIDDVIVGCITQVGHQGMNIGRQAVLAAGWPAGVPGTTVDRQDASSQQAVHAAAAAVAAGTADLVVAAGVEVTSTTPLGANVTPRSFPFGPRVVARYRDGGGLVPQGAAADAVAERWGLDREALDAWAFGSRARAAGAAADGCFAGEVVTVADRRWDKDRGELVESGAVVAGDEALAASPAPAPDVGAGPQPLFSVEGRHTAATVAPLADGAAAVLVASEARAVELGLPVRALVAGAAVAGIEPAEAPTAATAATRRLLARGRFALADVDRVELHEGFAAVPLAWAADLAELGADLRRVNPDGGALALGHPLGAAGARQVVTLLAGLERGGHRRGISAIAGAGGVGAALLLERP
jgi:acetyl-CoA acyltransferase